VNNGKIVPQFPKLIFQFNAGRARYMLKRYLLVAWLSCSGGRAGAQQFSHVHFLSHHKATETLHTMFKRDRTVSLKGVGGVKTQERSIERPQFHSKLRTMKVCRERWWIKKELFWQHGMNRVFAVRHTNSA
jgi:hypothetical protein